MTKKVQRIKMRIHQHPVKHDGTVIAFDLKTGVFKVSFDGPLDNTTFYPWGVEGKLVIDKQPLTGHDNRLMVPEGANFWEVL